MPLTDDKIQQLLEKRALGNIKTRTGVAPPQQGPLRFHDREMICTSRRCGSPTYIKVQGASKCMMHALMELNLMLVESGFKGVVTQAGK